MQVSSPAVNDNGQETDNGKRSFGVAEADCLTDSFLWPNRKELFFSSSNEELDYMSELLPVGTITGAWIGLDNRDSSTNWTSRYHLNAARITSKSYYGQ